MNSIPLSFRNVVVLTALGYLIASVGAVVYFVLRCIFASDKLMDFLAAEKHERWEELTTFGFIGPGGLNSEAALRYTYGKLDDTDETIAALKANVRRRIKHLSFGLLSVIAALIILFQVMRIYGTRVG